MRAAKLKVAMRLPVFNKGFVEIESQEKTALYFFFFSHSVFTLFSFLIDFYDWFTFYLKSIQGDVSSNFIVTRLHTCGLNLYFNLYRL